MKRLILLVAVTFSFLVSCEKEQLEMGSQISVRGLSTTSVEVAGTVFVTASTSEVEYGFRYSTESKVNAGYYTYNETTVSMGTGNGSFVSTVSNLDPATTYYVHPYAYHSGRVYRGDEKSFNTLDILPTTGDTAQGGGVIFFDDGIGGGLEVLPTAWDGAEGWGCIGTDISGLQTGFGWGYSNMVEIQTACTSPNIAAAVCDAFTNNGFSDWHLPSLGELDSIYVNAYLPGHLTIPAGQYYSSNQVDANNAYAFDFSTGMAVSVPKNSTGIKALAVRAFW